MNNNYVSHGIWDFYHLLLLPKISLSTIPVSFIGTLFSPKFGLPTLI